MIENFTWQFVMFLDQRDKNKIAMYARICVNINIMEGLLEDAVMIIGDHKLV